jgi:hypothetical protein
MDLAALEAEAFLSGNWKNFQELEESISLPELNSVLDAMREKEKRHNDFMAAIQGIDVNSKEKGEMKSITELALSDEDEEKVELEKAGVAVLEGDW